MEVYSIQRTCLQCRLIVVVRRTHIEHALATRKKFVREKILRHLARSIGYDVTQRDCLRLLVQVHFLALRFGDRSLVRALVKAGEIEVDCFWWLHRIAIHQVTVVLEEVPDRQHLALGKLEHHGLCFLFLLGQRGLPV